MLYLFDTAATFRRGVLEKLSFVLLIYLDLALTFLALALGLVELNPYMQSLLANPPLLFFTKLVASVFIAWLVPGRLLLPAITFMLFVIGRNVRELILFVM